MMTVTFYGGAGGVTGSKHLVETSGKRILLDCGTFQGLPDVWERNRVLPFRPETIDQVVLSHAHVDHCGMLLVLVKRGFTGPIFATAATKEAVNYMLRDMVGIEASDAEWRRKHRIGAPDERVPLFEEADVGPAMDRFVEVPYARKSKKWYRIDAETELKFYDAGHIIGSAVSVLRFKSADLTIAYTGDLGSKGMPILFDPEVPEENIRLVICESTYGSRKHQPLQQALDRMAEVIRRTYERGGKMIVPAFSLGRTQEVVYWLHKMVDSQQIPRFPIYVDSPLALDLTDVYRHHRDDYDDESWTDFPRADDKPLSFRNLRYITSRDESISLNQQPGPFMVIAGSGMMSAGRIVHHLKNNLSDPRNVIFVTGYQAEGTLGRRILEGAKQVEIFGEAIKVEAKVELFNELSAHADREQLQDYLEHIKGIEKVVLVHGEPHQADDLKKQLQQVHPQWQVTRPEEGDVLEIG